MSSDGEKKLTAAEIAYPSAPSTGGYVDHYVGQRRQPEPEPPPKPLPPNEEPPGDRNGLEETRPSSKGKSRWALLLLAALAAGGLLAQGRFGKELEPESAPEIKIRVISEPPAHVYRRQLELGVTPLEVVKDETGTELKLTRDGYQNSTVSFAGASPGAVKEVRITLNPVPSVEPSTSHEPAPQTTPDTPITDPTPTVATSTAPPPTAVKPQPVADKPARKPRRPVAAQPPPPLPPAPVAPAYRPPPRPVSPPQTNSGGGHRIKPPDF